MLVRAKLQALALFVTVFALAMNAVPSVFYPLLQNQKLPIGVLGTLWLVVAHLTACLAACLFGFLVPLAVRELLWAVVGPRVFRRISAIVQFVAVLCVTSALLLCVTARVQVGEDLRRADAPAYLSPPMWFVGLYETIAGPVVRAIPAQGPWRRQYWTLPQNQGSRAAYLAHAPAFAQLAGIGIAALVALALICLAAFAIGRRRVVPPGGPDSALSRAVRRNASGWASRCLVRHPVSQAGFFFTLQTLGRSDSHRAYALAFIAYTFGFASVERLALATGTGIGALAGGLCAALVATSLYGGWLLRRGEGPIFDDPPEEATQRLDLVVGG